MLSWKQPMTYRDLQKWLRTLTSEQLDAPVLITSGADDFGGTEYVALKEPVTLARENPQIAGGYEGPALLVERPKVQPPHEEVSAATRRGRA